LDYLINDRFEERLGDDSADAVADTIANLEAKPCAGSPA
jgi:hypothetical protein